MIMHLKSIRCDEGVLVPQATKKSTHLLRQLITFPSESDEALVHRFNSTFFKTLLVMETFTYFKNGNLIMTSIVCLQSSLPVFQFIKYH